MINFWYVSRSNEIFIDTDNLQRSIKHTCSRLMGAIKCGRLNIEKLEFHSSRSENHIHTLITLSEPMENIQRYVWAIILHSDLYRGCATIMRDLHGVSAADIFITPEKFEREPDAICECEQKHNAEVMQNCSAAIKLRGENRTRGFFGLPEKEEWTLEQIATYIRISPLELWHNEQLELLDNKKAGGMETE